MKKLIGIIFVVVCFFSTNVEAASHKHLLEKLKGSYEASTGNQSSEKPSFLCYNFNTLTYEAVIADLCDSDWFANIDYHALFPKAARLDWDFDIEHAELQACCISQLQKSPEQVANAASTLLDRWQKYCVQCRDECEESYMTYTPFEQDEKGHYSSEFFYSCIDREDAEEQEHCFWGKILITEEQLIYRLFGTSKESAGTKERAAQFLSSSQYESNNCSSNQ